MTRLSELNPQWRRIYRDREQTADRGGFPTEDYELSFRCPKCGPPARCSIRLGPAMKESPRTWLATPVPDGVDWPERVTISPSINWTTAGHGPKRPPCTFHGSIINGEVFPS